MKFLLNMNVPPTLGRMLAEKGHECRHVRDIGMARTEDIQIVEEAKLSHETILTHDLDYGTLLAFSGETKPSVVIFRLRYVQPHSIFARMMHVWSKIELPLIEGTIVVLEDGTLRLRKLPIIPS